MRTSGKLFLALLLVLGLTLGTAQAAHAFEFDDDGIVGPDEVIDDDLIISGETVTIDGTVNGIAFVSGGRVTVNGTVEGDLLVNGSDVTINGHIGGSVACFGQSLVVNGGVDGSVFASASAVTLGPTAVIGRNVSFFGFGLETQAGSTIGRDVTANGFQALLAGRIGRDVDAETGALEISGDIGGDVTASVDKPAEESPWRIQWPGGPALVAPGLRVAETARISGTLTYSSPVDQAGAIRATPGGGVVYQPVQETVRMSFAQTAAQWLIGRVREMVTLLVLGGLAVWRAPALLERLAERVRRKPLPSLGWGLLAVVAGYGGAVLLALLILIVGILLGVVTLGGLAQTVFGIGFSGLGVALAAFTLLVTYGSKLVVAVLIGKLLLRLVAPQAATKPIWPLLLGLCLYVPLRSVFVLGWFIGAAATLLGIGAMVLLFREWRAAATVS